jgi:hypothetical protein
MRRFRLGLLVLLTSLLTFSQVGWARPSPKPEVQNVATKHISGFEVGSFEWDGFLHGGTLETTIVRTGPRFKVDADGEYVDNSQYQYLGAATEIYFRFYLYIGTLPTASSPRIFEILDTGSGNDCCDISISNDGEVFLNSRIGTAIQLGTVTTGKWYRIEGHVITHPTAGTIEGRLDGGAIVSATNRDTGTGAGNYILGCLNTVGSAVFYFDDFHLNDTTGTSNNSWPGEGECYTLFPNSDASPNNWTASAGGSHFEAVNDTTSAEYLVTTSSTSNLEDRWGMENLSDKVPVQSTVIGMMGGVFGQGFGSGPSRDTKLRFRDDSGNTLDGATHTWTVGFSDLRFPHTTAEQTWEGSPVPLTVDYIDGMFMSAIDFNTNTREIRWYSAWLTVEVIAPKPILTASEGILSPIFNGD